MLFAPRVDGVIATLGQGADGLLDDPSHQTIADDTARNGIAVVAHGRAVR